MTAIGIIGGSGMYQLEGLTSLREIKLETPFGAPSDALVTGELDGLKLVFLPRHGRGHRLLPSEVPYRANVFALKSLGVEYVISVSAVGSLKDTFHPGEVVVPAQYVDRTCGRASTFFGEGLVAHVSLADPVCARLARVLTESSRACGLKAHENATALCIEGPAFSTRAESQLYRGWGMDIIGMTSLPEARLAREAELHYATLALVTDYDCWHETEQAVTVETVVQVLGKNTANVKRILANAVPALKALGAGKDHSSHCPCATALANAIISDPTVAGAEQREALRPIIGKYLP